MTNQTNEAAERSAHVTRGEKPAPAEWPVMRMPNGTWKLKSVVALEARIAELEAALRQIEADCDADYPPSTGAIKYAARAALEGGKDE